MWEKCLGFPFRRAVSRKARQRSLPLRKLKTLKVMPEAEVGPAPAFVSSMGMLWPQAASKAECFLPQDF